MNVDLTPTLVEMYRETFEGEVHPGWTWIVGGAPEESVLGTLQALTAEQAYAEPASGRQPIAAHANHLKYALELTLRRLHGENPPTDWPGSFNPGPALPAAWENLQADLRQAYEGVLDFFNALRDKPIAEWQPIHAVGLSAMIGHNAYHLGAIRQLLPRS
ncbi:DinB family protein [Lacipirellula parvula]|uniref:DinB-like domain-containing protein n=1 Tax=Lacipirellula parvula TaxID=2650471 RepID=A0A5K7XD97_9BACT|nr:DinB family protein [Lacipirellula parvula]BBO34764.1 hypothetical protein PLANPX_4376 [Lacipirellula parvula]